MVLPISFSETSLKFVVKVVTVYDISIFDIFDARIVIIFILLIRVKVFTLLLIARLLVVLEEFYTLKHFSDKIFDALIEILGYNYSLFVSGENVFVLTELFILSQNLDQSQLLNIILLFLYVVLVALLVNF